MIIDNVKIMRSKGKLLVEKMGKSILKNSIFNVLNKGLSVIYPMITAAYISRIFHADGVGEVSFAINIITYFTIAASLGIPNYAIKVLATVRDNRAELNKTFSELALIITISSLIVSVVYYAFIICVYSSATEKLNMSLILGLMLLFNIMNYDWLYEALEEYCYLAVRSITVKIFALFLMFVCVHSSNDLAVYCFIYALVSVANNILNGINSRKYVSLTFKKLDIRQHLKPVFILFAAAIATEFYTLLDSTMLGIRCEPEFLGYYSNASRVARAAYGVIFSIIAVYNPRLSYLYKQKRKDYNIYFQQYYDRAMFLSFPASIGLLMLAPFVITVLFGNGYEAANITLMILSTLIIVFTLATVFGHIPLVIYGKEKLILIATIVGAVTNFGLNNILIPVFRQNGAAMASIISEVLVTAILMIGSLNVVKIKLFNKSVMVTIFSTIIMMLYLHFVRYLRLNHILILSFGIIGGVIVYMIMSLLLGNSIMLSFIKRVNSWRIRK